MATKRTAAQRKVTKEKLNAPRTHKALEYALELSPFILKWESEGYSPAEIVELLNDGGAVVPSEYNLDRKDRVAPVPVKEWTRTQYDRLRKNVDVVREKMAFAAKKSGVSNVQVWGDGAGLFANPEAIGLSVQNHFPYRDHEPKRETMEWEEWRTDEESWRKVIRDAFRDGNSLLAQSALQGREKHREGWRERAARSRGLPWPPVTPREAPQPVSAVKSVKRRSSVSSSYVPFMYRPESGPPSEFVIAMAKLKPGSPRRKALARQEWDRYEAEYRRKLNADPGFAKAEKEAEKAFLRYLRGRGPRPAYLGPARNDGTAAPAGLEPFEPDDEVDEA